MFSHDLDGCCWVAGRLGGGNLETYMAICEDAQYLIYSCEACKKIPTNFKFDFFLLPIVEKSEVSIFNKK